MSPWRVTRLQAGRASPERGQRPSTKWPSSHARSWRKHRLCTPPMFLEHSRTSSCPRLEPCPNPPLPDSTAFLRPGAHFWVISASPHPPAKNLSSRQVQRSPVSASVSSDASQFSRHIRGCPPNVALGLDLHIRLAAARSRDAESLG